ncbi:seminase-like [Teleopsis dalmanni]|uniref:seminase-like n=1 Tax=Teleopsis dalmanni TaxID=139649 RepID=UPI0018CCA4D5|nr:seminase-like [Teleopsis dalmanni]
MNFIRTSLLIVLCIVLIGERQIFAAKVSRNATANISNRAKIIGGRKTTIANMKYLVNLRKDGRFVCGGALVKPQFVVSAAHCVKGVALRRFTVHAGSSYLDRGSVTRKIIKAAIPKSFTMTRMRNDVAVLKLGSPLTGENIGTINLCSGGVNVGRSVQVSGWGVTKSGTSRTSNQVKTATLKIISKSRCTKRYRRQAVLSKSMMCARWKGRDTCQGDSGGPLVYNGELCGITSWGIGCANRAYPGIYTNVNVVRGFIQKNMK